MTNAPDKPTASAMDKPIAEWKTIPAKIGVVILSAALGFGVRWQLHTGGKFLHGIWNALTTELGAVAARIEHFFR